MASGFSEDIFQILGLATTLQQKSRQVQKPAGILAIANYSGSQHNTCLGHILGIYRAKVFSINFKGSQTSCMGGSNWKKSMHKEGRTFLVACAHGTSFLQEEIKIEPQRQVTTTCCIWRYILMDNTHM